MNSYRKSAIIVGVLFIVGTVAGSLSVVLTSSILGATDYLTQIAANETQMITGALLVLVMAAALIAVPLVMFPIFKRYDERMALGYIVARSIEGVGYVVTAIILLALVALSRQAIGVGASDISHLHALGDMLLSGFALTDLVGVYIVFNLGALVFYFLLYRSKLIPRFISAWGIIAALMWLSGVVLVLFGLIDESSLIYTLSFAPMFGQEMVMALWLIFKGFNPSAIDSGPVNKEE